MRAQTCATSTARHVITAAIRTLVMQNYTLSERWSDDDGGILISATVQESYEGIAKRLIQDLPAYRDRFSVADITKRLRSLVIDIVRAGRESEVEALIGRFWARLENQDERKVCYVPLDGLKLSTPRVEIGKFNLQRMDDNALVQAVSLMEASVGEVVHQGDDAAEYLEIKKLRQTVHSLIAVVCNRAEEFSTPKDVLSWVNQQGAELGRRVGWKKPQMRLTGSRPYHRRSTQHGRIEDGLN